MFKNRTHLIKKILFLGIVSSFIVIGAESAMAQDHTFGVEFRTDLQVNSSNRDSDVDINGDDKATQFKVARARANFRGKLNDETSYRVRLRFNKSLAKTGIDKTSPALDYFYLTRKLNSSLGLRVGKFKLAAASMENFRSSISIYNKSQSRSYLGGLYMLGGQLTYKGAGQKLIFQLTNSPVAEKNSEKNQSALGITAAWRGSLLGGLIEPIISYSSFPGNEQKSKDATGDTTVIGAKNQSQYGVGTRINLGDLHLELEQTNYTKAQYDTTETTVAGASSSSSTDEESITSTVFDIRYTSDYYQPFIKYLSDNKDVEGKDSLDRKGISLGLEYFPDKTFKTYRIHAVYLSNTETPTVAGVVGDSVTKNQINLGISAKFN